jgi:hypothetical protein
LYSPEADGNYLWHDTPVILVSNLNEEILLSSNYWIKQFGESMKYLNEQQ